jgi:hypothetical protein
MFLSSCYGITSASPRTPATGPAVCVLHHQPLAALGVEVDLDARVAAAPLEVQHHALAEHLVVNALPEAQSRISGCRRAALAMRLTGRVMRVCRRTSFTRSAGISRTKRDGVL